MAWNIKFYQNKIVVRLLLKLTSTQATRKQQPTSVVWLGVHYGLYSHLWIRHTFHNTHKLIWLTKFFSFTFFLCSVNLFTTKRTTIIVLFFVNKLLLPISPGPLSWIWLKTKTKCNPIFYSKLPNGPKGTIWGGGGHYTERIWKQSMKEHFWYAWLPLKTKVKKL